MRLLDKIVKEMLEEHVGGENFFDNLDKKMQEHTILAQLFCSIPVGANIIVSGKFGLFFHSNFPSMNIIVVNGGLRKGEPIVDLEYAYHRIKGRSFVFVDDSFYSGKTRDAVKAEIERHDGKLVETYVIYDGSLAKDDTVHSLYRYYSNHPIVPNDRPIIKEEKPKMSNQTVLTINQIIDIFGDKISRTTISAMIYTSMIRATKNGASQWEVPLSELPIIQEVIDKKDARGVQQAYQAQLEARKSVYTAQKAVETPNTTPTAIKPATDVPTKSDGTFTNAEAFTKHKYISLSNLVLIELNDCMGVYEVKKHRGNDNLIKVGTKFITATIATTALASLPRVTILDESNKLVARNWM